MKTTGKIILTGIFILLFTFSSYATNTDEYYSKGLEASCAEELSEYLDEEARGYLRKLGVGDMELENILDFSVDSVIGAVSDMIKNGFRAPVRGFMTASGTALLISIFSSFYPEDEKNRIILSLISGSVIITGIFLSAKNVFASALYALECCVNFEKALIPVLTGIISSSGNPIAALSYKGTAFAAAEFISSFSRSFALPLAGISGAFGIAGAIMPTLRLSTVSEVIRKTMTTTLASAASLFSGFLALKNVLSSSADGIVTKGVRLASGAFIPVVGNTIGELYSSVIGSMCLIKNTVAMYAVIAVFVVCVPVIINTALWILSMRAACAVSDLLGCRECSEILKNISFMFSMVNTVLIFCAIVFAVSSGLVIAMKTGD